MPQKIVLWCWITSCLTALVFAWMVRDSLCELHIKRGNTEVAVILAYGSES
ncbi:Hok/Gef family protein [Rahnella sp. SAP-1]|uniref:Hok/Gef family protein n=1 Tax=Rouxiella aceris TaxID=2703884 RepID=A0A848MR52_9GAMM|nr:Hok/Gef family protein [Rouxiella aceris]NMP29783.1 Hok/Gef family protein [Rouxiella aceris]